SQACGSCRTRRDRATTSRGPSTSGSTGRPPRLTAPPGATSPTSPSWSSRPGYRCRSSLRSPTLTPRPGPGASDTDATAPRSTSAHAEPPLQRFAIPTGIRRSVVCYPVGRVVAIDRGNVSSAVDLLGDLPDELLVLFCRHWPPLSPALTRTSAG